MSLATLIMAAGKGTRMKSELAKVLHKLNNKTMIEYVIEQAKSIESNPIVVIVGHQKDTVKDATQHLNVQYVDQDQQLGTGHAVMQAEELFSNIDCDILVLSGDVPLLSKKTLNSFYNYHRSEAAVASILTVEIENPDGYGRVLRNTDGSVKEIVEHKDASDEQRQVKEINSGIYIFNSRHLFNCLKLIKNNNSQGEYYLPDVVPLMLADSLKVVAMQSDNELEISGINTIEQLQDAEKILKNGSA
ncbi:MAG: NTP transferase domain-containing protein [Calditrichaeota bacterium]|nr:NTP transferase domain-containing protein [Calditrichota bacterium]